MAAVLLLVLSYLIGSIPIGLIVGRYYGVDLRTSGSGNIGTTNAFRVIGRRAGTMVLVGDVLKGFVPVLLGHAVGSQLLAVGCGLAAIGGHCWSIFLKFRGGRGVATAAGTILALSPLVLLFSLLTWGAVVLISRYVSLGSMVAAAAAPVYMAIFNQPGILIVFGIVAAVIIIWQHRPNIERLLAGTENKVWSKPRRVR